MSDLSTRLQEGALSARNTPTTPPAVTTLVPVAAAPAPPAPAPVPASGQGESS